MQYRKKLRGVARTRMIGPLAEIHHGMGLREAADRHLPGPGSNLSHTVLAFVESLVLLLSAGGCQLEDLCVLLRTIVGAELTFKGIRY